MSGATAGEAARPVAGTDRGSVGRRARDAVRGSLSTLAFWIAIALPALYLPLLIVGFETVTGLATFLTLVGVHLLALVAGRGHAATG